MAGKFDEKVFKEFASKYDYFPGEAKDLADFIRSLHDFVRRMGGTQYYNEDLNKKMVFFGIDVETALLEMEGIRLEAERFYNEVGKAALKGRPSSLDRKEVEAFKKSLSALRNRAKALHSAALEIAA